MCRGSPAEEMETDDDEEGMLVEGYGGLAWDEARLDLGKVEFVGEQGDLGVGSTLGVLEWQVGKMTEICIWFSLDRIR